MATNPFTPVGKPTVTDSPSQHVGLHIVQTAVHKYAMYLEAQRTANLDLVIAEGKRKVRQTYIETADHYYNQIPEEYR
jgi:hypothetical protein